MFSNALVATDLSPASDAVIECLGGLRLLGTTQIVLLHAVFVPLHYPETYDTEAAVLRARVPKLEEQGRALREMGFQVDVQTAVGSPPRMICRLADERDVSLIVVGSHGASLQRDILLGSVANEVIHRATRPVLVMRQAITEDEGGETRCEVVCKDLLADILYPTDFSDTAERAFTYLEMLARSGARRIRLFHVQDRAKLEPHLADRLAEFNATDLARLGRLKDRLSALGVGSVDAEIRYGSPSAEIVNEASQEGTSLIVMGSHGRGFLAEVFLGSVAHNVVRVARVPVLLVPAARE